MTANARPTCRHCNEVIPAGQRVIRIARMSFHSTCYRTWNAAYIAARQAESIAPTTNAEARQLAELDAEQPEAQPGPWYTGLTPAEADKRYSEMQNAAVDWQYFTVKSGGMARKSDLDAYLRARFGLDAAEAHTISNSVESRADFIIEWGTVRWTSTRPEPTEAEQIVCPECATTQALTDERFICPNCGYAEDTYIFDAVQKLAIAQPAAQLFDPIATLPIFSGTAPRVDDPGRYDPPARSTDVQPKLF
jgi:ribosomal protein S27AE